MLMHTLTLLSSKHDMGTKGARDSMDMRGLLSTEENYLGMFRRKHQSLLHQQWLPPAPLRD